MADYGEFGIGSPEAQLERLELVRRLHDKFEEARNLNAFIERGTLSRRFLVEAAANDFVPAQHVRVSLIPKARTAAHNTITNVKLRVPLMERGPIDETALVEGLFDVPHEFQPGKFLTNDVFVELRNGDALVGDYLLNGEGLVPYKQASDIGPAIQPEVWGNYFHVQTPTLSGVAPQEIQASLWHMLDATNGYDIDLQDNLPRSA